MSLDEQAMALYRAYPKKVARAAALKAIRKALQLEGFGVLMEAVTAYAAARDGQDRQYTPYPATWFNQQRWADDREEWGPSGPAICTDEAWGIVRNAIREHGTHGFKAAREVLPSDIASAASQVGWMKLCDMNEFNRQGLFREFRSVYERASRGSTGNKQSIGTPIRGGVGEIPSLRAGDPRSD
jgi:hypothetical protein